MEKAKKKELIRTIKYVLIAASAGIIQFGSTAILALIWPVEKFANGPVLFYLIGLTLSVIWNLTINRKYTFKSANNMGIAQIKNVDIIEDRISLSGMVFIPKNKVIKK